MKHTVADIPKNKTEVLRVALDEYEGHDLLALRIFTPGDEPGQFFPTKKGVNFRVGMLPAVVEALTEALALAQEAGLVRTPERSPPPRQPPPVDPKRAAADARRAAPRRTGRLDNPPQGNGSTPPWESGPDDDPSFILNAG